MRTDGKSSGRKTVWVTGGAGFLGSHAAVMLRRSFDITLSYHRRPLTIQGTRAYSIDLTSEEEVRGAFSEIRPQAILHCAAMTDIEDCEQHYEEALRLNVEATRFLAERAAEQGIHLIFISTESVYGDRPGPHSEEDPLQPVNRYAYTKQLAEEAVQKAGGKWFIARTGFEGWSLTENASKQSFFEWVVQRLEEGRPFKVFEDRIFTPLSIYNLVKILEEVLVCGLEGLYNVESARKTTYLEFAHEIAREFGYDSSLIRPCKMDEILRGVKRPHDTWLRVEKIKGLLKTKLLETGQILIQFKKLRDSGELDKLKSEVRLGPIQKAAV